MKFLPFENISFSTTLSKAEVVSRLKENTEAEKTVRFGFPGKKKTKKYEGIIDHEKFAIKRIIN